MTESKTTILFIIALLVAAPASAKVEEQYPILPCQEGEFHYELGSNGHMVPVKSCPTSRKILSEVMMEKALQLGCAVEVRKNWDEQRVFCGESDKLNTRWVSIHEAD